MVDKEVATARWTAKAAHQRRQSQRYRREKPGQRGHQYQAPADSQVACKKSGQQANQGVVYENHLKLLTLGAAME